MRKLKKAKILIIFFAAVAFLCTVAILLPNLIICGGANKYIYGVNDIYNLNEEFDCILVLGAGVYSDGTPTPMLSDRLQTAILAYNEKLSDRILMSGDHVGDDYNEVGTMKRFAVENGVISNAVFLDHVGISTYDSVYRAVNIFGANKILIVTQGYHLPRAIYLAQVLGAEAYGISADLRAYKGQIKYSTREVAARVKDFVMSIFLPEAVYMGEKISLLGDGDTTND